MADYYCGNYYLSLSEMQVNATYIYNVLSSCGFSLNAICAMLGNFQQESTINSGIWQGLKVDVSLGFGLAQWTPSTNVTNWLSQNGYSNDDLYGQLMKILWERDNGEQYIATENYPLSFYEFCVSTESIEYLTTAWLKNYERAGSEYLQNRIDYANYWYKFLSGVEPPIPPTPTPTKRKKFKWYLFLKKL